MELPVSLLTALLFSMACNLDTVLLSMGYAARGARLPAAGALVIAAVTTFVTWLSLLLGDWAARLLPAGAPELLGALVLVGMGAWFLLDALRSLGRAEAPPALPRSLWACVSLAAALAVNNAGAGVAAGVSGVSPGLAAGCNFAVTVLFLILGRVLGSGRPGRWLGRLALPLSGALLIALGLAQVLL